LQRIKAKAFRRSALTSIFIPASITVLCESRFTFCVSLRWVTFENGSLLERIEESAFFQTDLENIVISGSVTFLEDFCFFSVKPLFSLLF
jgi:hypothetical protein